MDEPFGVNTAHTVDADAELAGVVVNDYVVLQQSLWRIAPHSAPSPSIRTGSGVTFSVFRPSACKCRSQSLGLWNMRSLWLANLLMTICGRPRSFIDSSAASLIT